MISKRKCNCYLILLLIIGQIGLATQYDVEQEEGVQLQKDEPVVTEPIVFQVVTNKTLLEQNGTMGNKTQGANETRKYVNCQEIVYESEEEVPTVEIINGTHLAKLLQVKPDINSPTVKAECMLVFFYTKSCPFSAQAAPHFNALARSYPNIKMVGLDALKYSGINAQYGIVGVPTLRLFHNGRPVAKFNGTEYNVHLFSKFLNTFTGQEPQGILVTSKDFEGPLSSVVVVKTDYLLILSWLFIIVCSIYYFMQSKWWDMIVEMIQNNWRESEAQHEHND
ncbi:thioredoxin domain-containing protein 15 [Aricia agestis]|uniref:thioredoxin domain-containing protein 15 n=1 Tax=Aricia agestis TaxID=91739 RepID=UPI001C207DB2|nr:thioredoxin domain-containing protein 15 [Aricia agestis]